MSTPQTIPAFIEQVVDNVNLGMIDVHLPHLTNIINRRLEAIRPKPLAVTIDIVRVGSRVKFNSKTRPTYLVGATATVKKVNRQRVKVQLDTPSGRFGSKLINTPVTILNFA